MLGGRGYTIVGVMPNEFTAGAIDAWIPAQLAPFMMRMRENRFLIGVGRMKPGSTIEQAKADLARIERELGEQFPATDKDWSAIVSDLKEQRVGQYRRALLLMFGSVGLLLLIAVANIASLTLAQLHQRDREMAIRSSVGASRGQVIATVMREVLLIAAVGAAGGAMVAALLIRVVATHFAELVQNHRTGVRPASSRVCCSSEPVGGNDLRDCSGHRGHSDRPRSGTAESSRSVSGGRRRPQRGLVIGQLAASSSLTCERGIAAAQLSQPDPGGCGI